LRHDVEDIARRHPAVFFGGMFVAGLAAARFFKASCETEPGLGESTGDEYHQETQASAPEQAAPAAAPQPTPIS
jgi:hypothetical protein